jgi:hypothetical protein
VTVIGRFRTVTAGWRGANGFTTFYYQRTADQETFDTGTAIGVTDAVQAFWLAAQSLFPIPWSATQTTQVDVLNVQTGEVQDALTVPQQAGVGGAVGVGFGPTMACMLMRMNTAKFVTGRRLIGRTFLGPMAAGGDADGTPTAAMIADLQAAVLALTPAFTVGAEQVVWSRPRLARAAGPGGKPKALTARAGDSAPVTGFVIPDKWATLRSRRD